MNWNQASLGIPNWCKFYHLSLLTVKPPGGDACWGSGFGIRDSGFGIRP